MYLHSLGTTHNVSRAREAVEMVEEDVVVDEAADRGPHLRITSLEVILNKTHRRTEVEQWRQVY